MLAFDQAIRDIRAGCGRACRALPMALPSRSGGIVVAGMLAAAGAYFASQALQLDLGGIALPGPGFLPLSLGAVLMACATLIGLGCWRSGAGEAVELGHRDVAIAVAALLAIPLIFEPLGALSALGLLAIAVLVLIGRVWPPIAIAAAGLGMAACWFFFQVLLGVQLPTGPW
jgi:putative tricarboxylic transport membrane protein